jgi:hypothetical protein
MDIIDQPLKVELATINVERLTQYALIGTNLIFCHIHLQKEQVVNNH